jgi:CRP-like cAMP-binding protein
MSTVQPPAENQLLALLPRKERRALKSSLEAVDLVTGDILCESGGATGYAYFPVDAIVSLLTSIDGKPVLEVGIVGREGMVGTELVLGVSTAPLHAVVQSPGKAWRIRVPALRRELSRSTALRRCLHLYLYVLMSQLSVQTACVRFHLIGQRLARWLLMTQDRTHADTLLVTHGFLAHVLGVRRVGVTTAAGELQREGLIQYRRGHILVRNRRGLEQAACVCYSTDRIAYAEFMR